MNCPKNPSNQGDSGVYEKDRGPVFVGGVSGHGHKDYGYGRMADGKPKSLININL
jgi:hypothetical protein